MGESSGRIEPSPRFSWGGAIATFFTEDGVHVFGKGSSRAQTRNVALFLGPATALGVITLLLWVLYFPKTPAYIPETLVLVYWAVGATATILTQRKSIRKFQQTFPKDPNLQDLLASGQAHKFFTWAEIRKAQFSKFRKNRILYIYLERRDRWEPMYYILGIPEDDKATQIDLFLKEKIGDRLKGTP